MLTFDWFTGHQTVHDPNRRPDRGGHRRRVHLGQRVRGRDLSEVEARPTIHPQHGKRGTQHQRQSGSNQNLYFMLLGTAHCKTIRNSNLLEIVTVIHYIGP